MILLCGYIKRSSDWMYALWEAHRRSLDWMFVRLFCVALSLWRIRLTTFAGDAMTIARVLCRGVSSSSSARCLTTDYRLSIFTQVKTIRGGGIFGRKIFLT